MCKLCGMYKHVCYMQNKKGVIICGESLILRYGDNKVEDIAYVYLILHLKNTCFMILESFYFV